MASTIEKDINIAQLYTSFDLCRNIILIMNSKFYSLSAFKELYKNYPVDSSF